MGELLRRATLLSFCLLTALALCGAPALGAVPVEHATDHGSVILQTGDDRLSDENETGNETETEEIEGEVVDGSEVDTSGTGSSGPNGGLTGGTASETGGGSSDSDSDSGGMPAAAGNGPGSSNESEEGNETAESGSGNESGTGSENESGPIGGPETDGGGGGFGFSPGEWVASALSSLLNIAISELEDAVNYFQQEGVGLPAPGDPNVWDSWTEDLSGPFQAATAVYLLTASMAAVWLLNQVVASFDMGAERRRKRQIRIFQAGIAILLGRELILPAGLHLFNELALIIAPAGQDFTDSFGNLARLGWGLIFGGLLVILSSFTVVLGILLLEATDIFVYVIYGLWPIIMAAWASEGQARAYGHQGHFTLGALFALSFAQACIIKLVFEIPWTGSAYSPAEAMIGTSIGLLVGYVYLPWAFVQQVIHGAAAALGTGAALASSQIDAAIDQHVFQRVEQYREESVSYDFERPQAGQVQQAGTGSGSATGYQAAGAVADGGTSGRPDGESWGSPPRDSNGQFVSPNEYEQLERDRIDQQY